MPIITIIPKHPNAAEPESLSLPAVSMKRNLIPSIINSSSIASRVVPAILLTIALSSFSNVFKRVDLPTFGAPIIDIGIPFLITFPSHPMFLSLLLLLDHLQTYHQSASSK